MLKQWSYTIFMLTAVFLRLRHKIFTHSIKIKICSMVPIYVLNHRIHSTLLSLVQMVKTVLSCFKLQSGKQSKLNHLTKTTHTFLKYCKQNRLTFHYRPGILTCQDNYVSWAATLVILHAFKVEVIWTN